MQPEIDLSGLRDLHLMAQPPIWPLATGWWLLLFILIAAVMIGCVGYHIWHQLPAVYAIRKLKKITEKEEDDLSYLKKISQLLRRVAIAADGRPKIARLSDFNWQKYLQQRIPHALTEKEAHLIAFAPYEASLEVSIKRSLLVEHASIWIKKVLKNKNSS